MILRISFLIEHHRNNKKAYRKRYTITDYVATELEEIIGL